MTESGSNSGWWNCWETQNFTISHNHFIVNLQQRLIYHLIRFQRERHDMCTVQLEMFLFFDFDDTGDSLSTCGGVSWNMSLSIRSSPLEGWSISYSTR